MTMMNGMPATDPTPQRPVETGPSLPAGLEDQKSRIDFLLSEDGVAAYEGAPIEQRHALKDEILRLEDIMLQNAGTDNTAPEYLVKSREIKKKMHAIDAQSSL